MSLPEAAAQADALAQSGDERALAVLRAQWDEEIESDARNSDYRVRAQAYRAIAQFRFRQKLELLRRGLDVCVDMKTHPEAHRAAVGAPPEIFSLDINLWVFRMAREVALRERPDCL